jgi:UDP-N-acetylglucosamine--N-acetylmuramyl-(pentapeptide) pyrophosphoryl-undecaprenol N-acetylglucosamine transferase
MAQMLQGTAAATAWLRTLGRRGVLVAFGAFPSVPLVLAARAAQWRVLLVELNAVPGRATRILHPFCDLVCLAYPSARRWLPGARVALLPGVPVRRAVRQAASDRQARASQPTEGKPLVLGVLGGSQGAVRLNRVVVETLSWLRPTLSRFWVVHQTGFRDWNVVRALYEENHFPGAVVPFLEDVSLVYRLADVVICRGGASTLAEIAACGIPAAVLPYPYAVANHQWHNARHLQQEFPLELVAHHDDDQKTAAALCCAIHRLLRCSPEARSSAQGKARVNSLGEAAQRLAQRVLELYES